jgi:RNA polymerase sigma-70 factor (ECF subfamily)
MPRAHGPTPSQVARHGELERALKQALAQLPERYRQIFLMHEMRHMSHEEIAAELGYEHAKTVRVKLAVAKRKLRDLLCRFAPGASSSAERADPAP